MILKCQKCSHRIKVKAADAGKRGRCPKCKSVVKVSGSSKSSSASSKEAARHPSKANAPKCRGCGVELGEQNQCVICGLIATGQAARSRANAGPNFSNIASGQSQQRPKAAIQIPKSILAVGAAILVAAALISLPVLDRRFDSDREKSASKIEKLLQQHFRSGYPVKYTVDEINVKVPFGTFEYPDSVGFTASIIHGGRGVVQAGVVSGLYDHKDGSIHSLEGNLRFIDGGRTGRRAIDVARLTQIYPKTVETPITKDTQAIDAVVDTPAAEAPLSEAASPEAPSIAAIGAAEDMYQRGEKLLEMGDSENAFKLFVAAARAGNREAANDLGFHLDNGAFGEDRRPEAIEWFQISAEGGYGIGIRNYVVKLGHRAGHSEEDMMAAAIFASRDAVDRLDLTYPVFSRDSLHDDTQLDRLWKKLDETNQQLLDLESLSLALRGNRGTRTAVINGVAQEAIHYRPPSNSERREIPKTERKIRRVKSEIDNLEASIIKRINQNASKGQFSSSNDAGRYLAENMDNVKASGGDPLQHPAMAKVIELAKMGHMDSMREAGRALIGSNSEVNYAAGIRFLIVAANRGSELSCDALLNELMRKKRWPEVLAWADMYAHRGSYNMAKMAAKLRSKSGAFFRDATEAEYYRRLELILFIVDRRLRFERAISECLAEGLDEYEVAKKMLPISSRISKDVRGFVDRIDDQRLRVTAGTFPPEFATAPIQFGNIINSIEGGRAAAIGGYIQGANAQYRNAEQFAGIISKIPHTILGDIDMLSERWNLRPHKR